MKIKPITPQISFGENKKNNHQKKKKYVDPLANFPLRALGYTNDIGVAINELAPNLARLFWVPALMYFGADVYDKYKNKGNKFDPNAQRAFSQAIFQAFASIIFPTIVGHMGQSGFSFIDKFKKDKISSNAQEQTYRYMKEHNSAHNLFKKSKTPEEILSNFEAFFSDYCDDKREKYAKKNIFAKAYDTLLANCRKGAIANSNKEKVAEFAKREMKALLEQCKDSTQMENMIDKKIFKLKAWKSLGAFCALAIAVKPIDDFTEKFIIKKCVNPQIKKLTPKNKTITEFANSK